MLKYKELFFELVKTEIKLKYRNSVLGIVWSMLNPLLMMVVYSVIFMAFFRNDIPNYPIYVLVGRILYQFFADSTGMAMDSIRSNSALIRKVYVPKYYFPLSRWASSFFTLVMAFIPLIIMMVLMGIPLKWINLLFIIPIIYLLAISGGIGLLLTSINVFFRDMKHLYTIVLMVIMYMTPIFYPASIIPEEYMPIIMLNPLYPIVEMFRDIVMYGVLPDVKLHVMAIIYAIVYPVIGMIVFYKTQDRFIYYL